MLWLERVTRLGVTTFDENRPERRTLKPESDDDDGEFEEVAEKLNGRSFLGTSSRHHFSLQRTQ
jgi:hypothetical protein